MEPVQVSREEFYKEVWSTPMSQLALKYGVSDVALAKHCRRMNVPRPGRGYWARRAAGAKIKRPPLPKPTSPREEDGLWLAPSAQPRRKLPRQQVPVLTLSSSLRSAAPIVSQVARALATAEADSYGRLCVRGRRGEVIAVTVAAHRRALLVLDAVARGLAERGHHALWEERPEDHSVELVFVVSGEPIHCSVVERLERIVPAVDGTTRDPLSRSSNYDYSPSGLIQLVVECQARKSWSDTATRQVDSSLGGMLLRLEGEAQRRQEERQREEDRQREQETRERQRERLEAERRLQADRVAQLMEMVDAWTQSSKVQAFLGALEAAAPAAERDESFVEWLRWARGYADHLAPFKRRDLLTLSRNDDVR